MATGSEEGPPRPALNVGAAAPAAAPRVRLREAAVSGWAFDRGLLRMRVRFRDEAAERRFERSYAARGVTRFRHVPLELSTSVLPLFVLVSIGSELGGAALAPEARRARSLLVALAVQIALAVTTALVIAAGVRYELEARRSFLQTEAVERAREEAVARQRSAVALLRNLLPDPVIEAVHRDEWGRINRLHASATVVFVSAAGVAGAGAELEGGGARGALAGMRALMAALEALAERHGGVSGIAFDADDDEEEGEEEEESPRGMRPRLGSGYGAGDGRVRGRWLRRGEGEGGARVHHTEAAAAFALDAVDAARALAFSIKAGLFEGPLVSGVIGCRLAFDVFGDACNLAQRMCLHGIEGRVQLPTAARDALQAAAELRAAADPSGAPGAPAFAFSPPRIVLVKGRGPLATCLLERDSSAAAAGPRPPSRPQADLAIDLGIGVPPSLPPGYIGIPSMSLPVESPVPSTASLHAVTRQGGANGSAPDSRQSLPEHGLRALAGLDSSLALAAAAEAALRRASDPAPYPTYTGFGALVPPASLDLAARESVEGSVAGSMRGSAPRSLRLGPAYLPSASLLSKLPFASGASVKPKGDRSGAPRPRSSRRIAPEIPSGSELDAGGSGAAARVASCSDIDREPSCRGSGSWAAAAAGAGALRRSSRSRGLYRDRDLDREPGDPESAAALAASRPRPSARSAAADPDTEAPAEWAPSEFVDLARRSSVARSSIEADGGGRLSVHSIRTAGAGAASRSGRSHRSSRSARSHGPAAGSRSPAPQGRSLRGKFSRLLRVEQLRVDGCASAEDLERSGKGPDGAGSGPSPRARARARPWWRLAFENREDEAAYIAATRRSRTGGVRLLLLCAALNAALMPNSGVLQFIVIQFLKYLANALGSSAELRGRYALRGASVAVLAAGFAASRLLSRSHGPLRRRLRWVAAAAVHAQVAAVAAGPVLSYLDHAFGFVGLEVAALSAAARTVN
eukprot:tig00021366_g20847.t1